MRKRNSITAVLAVAALGLVGCKSEPQTSESAKPSSSQAQVSRGEKIGDFYLPNKAPTDYLNTSPDAIQDGDRNLLLYVDHLMTNSDYISHTLGDVNISIPVVGASMDQNISSFNLKVGNESINHAITTNKKGSVGAMDLNSCIVSYADPDSVYRSRETPQLNSDTDVFYSYDPDHTGYLGAKPEAYGANTYETIPNFQMFLESNGSPSWTFSSYYLPDTTAIKSTDLISENDETMTFRVDLNVDATQGANAAQYYINQMKAQVASVGALSITIESLTVEITLPRDSFAPVSMSLKESYSGGLEGMQGTLFKITNTMSATFDMLGDEGLDSSLVKDYERQVFQEARAGDEEEA